MHKPNKDGKQNARISASDGDSRGIDREPGGRNLDALGHDTAHDRPHDENRAYQGGTTGRSTAGRAGDDLTAGGEGVQAGERGGAGDMSDATDRQRDAGMRRQGLEGKGFDAGTGYGGAGNEALYSGESSYGGQSGIGGSTTRGAYSGERYGRSDDADLPQSGTSQNVSGAGERSAPERSGQDDDVDLDELPDAGRRDPVR